MSIILQIMKDAYGAHECHDVNYQHAKNDLCIMSRWSPNTAPSSSSITALSSRRFFSPARRLSVELQVSITSTGRREQMSVFTGMISSSPRASRTSISLIKPL